MERGKQRNYFYLLIGLIVIAALILVGIFFFRKPIVSPIAFQKGMAYVAWTKDGYRSATSVKSMEELAALGVDWVALAPTWYQDRLNSTKIYPLREKTPSDDSLLFALRKLHELGFKVMLKPHLDIIEAEGKWRGEIECEDLAKWQAWFAGYTDFILHYVRLAEQEKAELFCIGTELTCATLGQPDLWRKLIKEVRREYTGQLTYAANWFEEFNNIEFWDDLDYAGVDPYFPLSSSAQPSKEELIKSWEGWLQSIEQWQAEIDKPVIFTEIGYKSSAGAAEEPWQHLPTGAVDLQLQADCYEALLRTFYEKPWFYGVYWWYWGVNPKMGGNFHRGFIPQNKTASEIIDRWYRKTVPAKKY